MEPTRFDTLTRSLRRTPSRRTALRTALGGVSLASAGWLADPSASRAKKKCKKKCPVCPPPPSPPPVPFCAGKNQCATTEERHCHQPGSSPPCACYIRADNAGSFCGRAGFTFAANCSECADGTVCVVLGGPCGGGFACFSPCPNPL